MNGATERRADAVTVADKVEFLRRLAAAGSRPETIETHMSWVFLTGDRVYKLKKPVVFPFLDYRTLRARRVDCEAELRLNRALAPGVYLATAALVRGPSGDLFLRHTDGETVESSEGEIVDWLVVMRRLPRSEMLDHRLRSGHVTAAELDALVAHLCAFYAAATPAPRSPALYRRDLIEQARADHLALITPGNGLDHANVALIASNEHRAITASQGLDERAARIVEGHGDIRPEHVLIGSQPVVIDLPTFQRRFRLVDPLYDLALLAVECEFFDAADIGEHVLHGYQQRAGDRCEQAVVSLYRARRAITRARLSIAHLSDGEPHGEGRAKWIDRANTYLEIGQTHLAQLGC